MIDAQGHDYEDKFFDYIEAGARRSARHFVGLLRDHLSISSVLDVGCGRGVWADEWRKSGIEDAVGVDGSYVRIDRLAVPANHFVSHDISEPFRLGRRFDLVQSLEVAEHIPASKADRFLENLVAHGDLILFSAAVPGQGGEFHVNEQPYEYWRAKFTGHGYRTFDFVRQNVSGIREVEPWYRYNALLFAQESALSRLPLQVRATEIGSDKLVPDVAPLTWRLRNMTLRCLPQPVVQRIAKMKHSVVRAGLIPG
jgi:SAM-dependent methyltransferase